MAESHQLEMPLPRRTRDDYAREELSAAVEALNAEHDPAERVRLHGEIERIRTQLGIRGAQ